MSNEKKEAPESVRLKRQSLPRSLFELGYRILGDRPVKIAQFQKFLNRNLARSGLRVDYAIYLSAAFLWSILLAGFFAVMGVLVLSATSGIVPSSFLGGMLMGVISGGFTMLMFYIYPAYRASNANRQLSRNLVYIANYMNVLTSAGATVEEVFLSFIRSGSSYGIRESARSIIRDVELLGKDIFTAMEGEVKRTPSKQYAELLDGLVTTIRTGGDAKDYLNVMANKYAEERSRLLNKLISSLSLIAEFYVALIVALPVMVMTMLTIMGFIFSGSVIGGLSIFSLMQLVVYIVLPLVSVMVVVFLDVSMSSW